MVLAINLNFIFLGLNTNDARGFNIAVLLLALAAIDTIIGLSLLVSYSRISIQGDIKLSTLTKIAGSFFTFPYFQPQILWVKSTFALIWLVLQTIICVTIMLIKAIILHLDGRFDTNFITNSYVLAAQDVGNLQPEVTTNVNLHSLYLVIAKIIQNSALFKFYNLHPTICHCIFGFIIFIIFFAFRRFQIDRAKHHANMEEWRIYYRMYWAKFNLSYYGDMTEYQHNKLRRRRARAEFYENTKEFFKKWSKKENLKIFFFGPEY